jgi:predicted Zn-ribbon and HTH transcriptional regulator
MSGGTWSKRRPKAPQLSRTDRKAEAEQAIAAFLARGESVKQMPPVVATEFACANCGHVGISGLAPGKSRRCPKCKTLLP